MSILFINGSPNPDGNTAGLADHKHICRLDLCENFIKLIIREFLSVHADHIVCQIQCFVILTIQQYIGSPLYWHNICGSVRTLLDRCYGPVGQGELSGKLFFIFQGAAPEKWMLEAGEYTMSRFQWTHLSIMGITTAPISPDNCDPVIWGQSL